MSAYCQWSLPANLGIVRSNSTAAQIERYRIMCGQVDRVYKEGKDIVIMTDDNINSLEDNSFSSIYQNLDIKSIRDNMIIQNSLVVYNNKPTFRRQGFNTCIDHLISNCPA